MRDEGTKAMRAEGKLAPSFPSARSLAPVSQVFFMISSPARLTDQSDLSAINT